MLELLLQPKKETGVFSPPSGSFGVTQSTPVNADNFGYCVAVSADKTTIAIGAYGVNSTAGAVFVFVVSGNTWTQQAKLVASDGASADYLGLVVGISGDGNTVIATAYNKAAGKGAVYVFGRSGLSWSQKAKLIGTQATGAEQFGFGASISTDGNTIAVGANNNNESGFALSGACYVFAKTGSSYIQQAKFFAPISYGSLLYGHSVSISADGNTLAVGARGYSTSQGAIYVHKRNGVTWEFSQRLQASDPVNNDVMGNFVCMSSDGSTIASAASQRNSNTGVVYVFVFNGTIYTQQAKLGASDAAINSHFGYSLAISSTGDVLFIGSYMKTSNTGQAYIFTRAVTTWTETLKKTAIDPATGDKFSWSLGMSGDASVLVATSPGKTSAKGKAYIFS